MRLEKVIQRAQNLIDRYESKEILPIVIKVDDLDEIKEDFNGLVLICNHKKFVKKEKLNCD